MPSLAQGPRAALPPYRVMVPGVQAAVSDALKPKPTPLAPRVPAQPGNPGFIGPVQPKPTPTSTVSPTGFSGMPQLIQSALRGALAGGVAGSYVPKNEMPQIVMPPNLGADAGGGGNDYGGGYGGGGYGGGGYGGGGYGGGGYGGEAAAPATSTTVGWGGLPTNWIDAFTKGFMLTPELYYTDARGGAEQALKDYQNLISIWQGRTNRPMTPEDLTRLMTGFGAYAMRLMSQIGRGVTWDDLINYLNLVLTSPVTPPQVSYLKTSEI